MKLAKKPRQTVITIKDLESKAHEHVQAKYFQSFFARYELAIVISLILVFPLVAGIVLANTLPEAILITIFASMIILTNVLIGGGITIGAITGINRYFKLHPGDSWTQKSQTIFAAFLEWVGRMVVSALMINLVYLGLLYVMGKIMIEVGLGGVDPTLFLNAYYLSCSIAMPMLFMTFFGRLLLAKYQMLPDSFVSERDKLRTPDGAIKQYLFDRIDDLEKQSFVSIDEMRTKCSLGVKRAAYYVSYLRASIKQEGDRVPSRLRESRDLAISLHENLKNSCEELEEYRAKVHEFYDRCRKSVKLMEKRRKDAKVIKRLHLFAGQAKQLPQQVSDFTSQHPKKILDGAEELDKALAQLRSEAEVVATLDSLPDASQESLEELEDVIERCVNNDVPKLSDDEDEE